MKNKTHTKKGPGRMPYSRSPGVCTRHSRPVTAADFEKYGMPVPDRYYRGQQ